MTGTIVLQDFCQFRVPIRLNVTVFASLLSQEIIYRFFLPGIEGHCFHMLILRRSTTTSSNFISYLLINPLSK